MAILVEGLQENLTQARVEGDGDRAADGAEPEPHQIFLSPRGGFGLYLKRKDVLGADGPLTTDDVGTVITDLLRLLAIPGILVLTDPPRTTTAVPGYQVAASALVWR